MCGIAGLGWEDRQDKANQILSSPEWKQQLCNDLLGLSFRDLERILTGIATERQNREENERLKIQNGKANRGRRGSRSKSMRGDSAGSCSANVKSNGKLGNSGQSTPKRTLAEILAQVYAPRVGENGSFGEREDADLEFYLSKRSESRDSLLSRHDSLDDKPEESAS